MPEQSPYITTSYQVDVGAMSFKMEALVDFESTVDQMFADRGATAGGDVVAAQKFFAHCPYFAALWPAARALALALSNPEAADLAGMRLLELGCGLALPGFVASRCGADVTVSDFHPDVPRFLQRNMLSNRISGLRYLELDWNLDTPPERGGQPQDYDLIVGSDLLYDSHQPERLAKQIRKLSHAKTRVMVADPGRAYLQDFHHLLCRDGYDVTTSVVLAPGFYGKPPVEILILYGEKIDRKSHRGT
jgi:predicted nicotinamide N-methyase